MPLEDLDGNKYISDLNPNWPAGTDYPDAGDNHLRGIKNVLQKSFPAISGPVTLTQDELNQLLVDVQQLLDDIKTKVAKTGDTMTGALTTPEIKMGTSGPSITTTFDTTDREDILFKTGPGGNSNTLRMGEGGGLNCKAISFRPDPAGDAAGAYITSGYYTAGTYSFLINTGNGSTSYPYKTFTFGQGGNASFPGNLEVAGTITAAGGINLALQGEMTYEMHVGDVEALPSGIITYMELEEDSAGKPVLIFRHRPLVGAV